MSRGIGAYYSPSKFRPVAPPPAGSHPASAQGIGAYYSPAPLRPVMPSETARIQPVEGWDSLDSGTKSFLAILGLVALGYFFLRGKN